MDLEEKLEAARDVDVRIVLAAVKESILLKRRRGRESGRYIPINYKEVKQYVEKKLTAPVAQVHSCTLLIYLSVSLAI